MAQHHNPKIVTNGLIYHLDPTNGGKGGSKILAKPTQISDCVLWLDADDKESIVLNGATVSDWLDKSGGGDHVSQSTSSYQPTYVANSINGRGAIDFDGTDNFLTRAHGDVNGLNFGIYDFCVFIAYENTVVDSHAGVMGKAKGWAADATDYGYQVYHYVVSGFARPYFQVIDNDGHSLGGGQPTASQGAVVGAPNITFGQRKGDSSNGDSNQTVTRYINGRNTVNNSSGGIDDLDTSASGFHIGKANEDADAGYLNGRVFEVIMYSKALSTDERQSVELYLSRKWNIPIQASHREQTSPSTIQSSSLPVSGFKNGKLDQVGNSMYFMGGPNTTGGYKDYINCGMVLGNGSSYSSGDPFTYEVWAKDHGSETSWKTLIGSVGYSQIFFYGNSSIRFGKNGGGDGGTHMLTHAGQLHEWHHIAAVWVGGIHHDFSGDISTGPYRRILYVNGEEVDKDKEVFYGGNITNNYIGSYHANGLVCYAA